MALCHLKNLEKLKSLLEIGMNVNYDLQILAIMADVALLRLTIL